MAVYVDDETAKNASSPGASVSQLPLVARVGRENLADAVPPHESYEGHHRWDPGLTWTAAEERKAVRKTDLYLLTWICFMVSFVTPSATTFRSVLTAQFFGLQLDRGNLSNALADNLLEDLHMNSDDYNNVSHQIRASGS